jgi:[ribosomal protein S5]-alanine N-acetyltransferase
MTRRLDPATITGGPWPHPDPQRSSLALVQVPAPLLHALARGAAVEGGEHRLTPYLLGEECAGLWRMRSAQITRSPEDAPWVTRLVVAGEAGVVGIAGFHGAPDVRGMVEVGYRIDPERRRRGHARRALETMLGVARAHPDVQVVRASISPDNDASRSLVQDYGFTEVGEQWDDEDGLEILFEVPA